MSSTQLSFSLSTSTKVKTVHLLGSWDNYSGQLPLSNKASSKAGKWKGTFRFSSSTMKTGKRYWYYFIIDGYHVSHDPSTSSTKEPTTGRILNILDTPKSSANPKRQSAEIPKGRSLSPSKIVCPKPSKPYASRAVREADYSMEPQLDDLADQLEKSSLYYTRNISPPSSISSGSSLSSRSSTFDRSSPASLSSLSDPSSSSSSGSRCSCNRFGLTRRGDRVRLDCGGSKCGYSDDSSSCSDIDEDSESDCSSDEEERQPRKMPSSHSKARYVEVKPKARVSSGGHARSSRR